MIITCTICNTQLTSLLIPQEKAAEQLSKTTTQHMLKCHKPEYEKILGVIAGLTAPLAYLVFMNACMETDDEFLEEKMEENEGMIMRALGYQETEAIENAIDKATDSAIETEEGQLS